MAGGVRFLLGSCDKPAFVSTDAGTGVEEPGESVAEPVAAAACPATASPSAPAAPAAPHPPMETHTGNPPRLHLSHLALTAGTPLVPPSAAPPPPHTPAAFLGAE